jgi:hypothetical protein
MAVTNAASAAERWVLEIERHEQAKREIMIEAAADCEPKNKLIREAKAAAKNEGISVKALSALILERKHLRNAAKVREKLDDEDLIAELEMLRDQVSAVAGVEDLFSFATEQLDGEITKAKAGKKAKGQPIPADDEQSEDDQDLRSTAQKEAEAARLAQEAEVEKAVADNVTKLRRGIKPTAAEGDANGTYSRH